MLATLSRITHEKFVDDEIGRLLERLRPFEESHPYDSDEASLIRVTRRDWEKARRVPASLREEMTREAAHGHQAWVEARRTSDFASFLPYLRRNVELKLRYVECFEWSDSPYTVLLDDYEPFMTTTEVAEIFARLRPALTELIFTRRPTSTRRSSRGRFPPDRSAPSPSECSRRLGLTDGSWRLDPTVHPFCTSFSNRDIRLTTRYHENDLESIWSTLHEAGPRALRARHRRLARADAARGRRPRWA